MTLRPRNPPPKKPDLTDLPKGRLVAKRERAPDQRDQLEVARLEFERERIKVSNERLFLGLREKYGNNIIRFLWVYSACAFLLILADGFGWWGFDMPDAAIVALISGAAVSALGVVGTVAAGLFKPPTD